MRGSKHEQSGDYIRYHITRWRAGFVCQPDGKRETANRLRTGALRGRYYRSRFPCFLSGRF
ncbi:Uncharacterised protein [Vibrio cholerae]|nr:Uncharacterised protein [Vibrio cholerae]